MNGTKTHRKQKGRNAEKKEERETDRQRKRENDRTKVISQRWEEWNKKPSNSEFKLKNTNTQRNKETQMNERKKA